MRLLHGVLIGGVFGAATSVVNHVPHLLGEVGLPRDEQSAATWIAEFTSKLLDSGWAWAALAVLVGRLAGTDPRLRRAALHGALTGAAALLLATVAYYGTDSLFGVDTAWWISRFWLIRAVVFGVPLGVVGACLRRHGVLGLLAGLVVPVGAAANMLLFPLWTGLEGETTAALWAQRAVWAGAAVAVVLVVLRFARERRPDPARAGLP